MLGEGLEPEHPLPILLLHSSCLRHSLSSDTWLGGRDKEGEREVLESPWKCSNTCGCGGGDTDQWEPWRCCGSSWA